MLQAKTDLNYLDIISFAGYKFVPMIFALGLGIILESRSGTDFKVHSKSDNSCCCECDSITKQYFI